MKCQTAAGGPGRALGARGDARRQQSQLEEIPPVERQIHNVVVRDHAAYRRGFQIDRRKLGADGYLVAQFPDFQKQVDAGLLPDR